SHWVKASAPIFTSMSCSTRLNAAVPGGAPDHASGGDCPAPSHVYWAGRLPPEVNAGLCTANGWGAAIWPVAPLPAAAEEGDGIGLARGKLGVGPGGVGRLGWGDGGGSVGGGAALQPAASSDTTAAAIHRRIRRHGSATHIQGDSAGANWHAFCPG